MSEAKLFAVLLAAGEGRRFGTTKQLADVGGRPMSAVCLSVAEQVCGANTVLVTGHQASAVLAASAPELGFVVQNSGYRAGMGTSISRAIAVVDDVADAVLIMLADQPFIAATELAQLIEQWRERPDCMVAAEYADTIGPPAIFPRDCFNALRELDADAGARDLLQNRNCIRVPMANAAFDVDRRQDLERA